MPQVLFFGRLREIAEAAGRAITFEPTTKTVENLVLRIASLDPDLGEAIKKPGVRCMVDGLLIPIDENAFEISTAKEIAFLPPVSGG